MRTNEKFGLLLMQLVLASLVWWLHAEARKPSAPSAESKASLTVPVTVSPQPEVVATRTAGINQGDVVASTIVVPVPTRLQ